MQRLKCEKEAEVMGVKCVCGRMVRDQRKVSSRGSEGVVKSSKEWKKGNKKE